MTSIFSIIQIVSIVLSIAAVFLVGATIYTGVAAKRADLIAAQLACLVINLGDILLMHYMGAIL